MKEVTRKVDRILNVQCLLYDNHYYVHAQAQNAVEVKRFRNACKRFLTGRYRRVGVAVLN